MREVCITLPLAYLRGVKARLRSISLNSFLFRSLLICTSIWIWWQPLYGQSHFLTPADSLHRLRLGVSITSGCVLYGGTMAGLYQVWYAESGLGRFHAFDDWNEWRNMDKLGHIRTAYHEAAWLTQGALWTGLDRRRALWLGTGTAFALQAGIEVLDGFADKWGFSWSDMIANTAGCTLYAGQELVWGEQRILAKLSFRPARYGREPLFDTQGSPAGTAADRAAALYGRTWGHRLLKDYNGKTMWLSLNASSFLSEKPAWLPPWLNLAIGVRANNLLGGFSNRWINPDTGLPVVPPQGLYPRSTSYFLSLDADLRRIRTGNPFLKTILFGLNLIKVPFPALEIRSDGQLSAHWLHF